MITKDNLKEVLQTLNPEDLQAALNGSGDFVRLSLHTFNAGAFGAIENCDYDEFEQEVAQADGDLYCSKDEFLQLCEETEALEF